MEFIAKLLVLCTWATVCNSFPTTAIPAEESSETQTEVASISVTATSIHMHDDMCTSTHLTSTPSEILACDTLRSSRLLYNSYCEVIDRTLHGSCAHVRDGVFDLHLPQVALTPQACPVEEDMMKHLSALQQVNHTLTSLATVGLASMLKGDCRQGDQSNNCPCALLCEDVREEEQEFYCSLNSQVISRLRNQILVLQSQYGFNLRHDGYADIMVTESSSRAELAFYNLGVALYAMNQAQETSQAVQLYISCSS